MGTEKDITILGGVLIHNSLEVLKKVTAPIHSVMVSNTLANGKMIKHTGFFMLLQSLIITKIKKVNGKTMIS